MDGNDASVCSKRQFCRYFATRQKIDFVRYPSQLPKTAVAAKVNKKVAPRTTRNKQEQTTRQKSKITRRFERQRKKAFDATALTVNLHVLCTDSPPTVATPADKFVPLFAKRIGEIKKNGQRPFQNFKFWFNATILPIVNCRFFSFLSQTNRAIFCVNRCFLGRIRCGCPVIGTNRPLALFDTDGRPKNRFCPQRQRRLPRRE